MYEVSVTPSTYSPRDRRSMISLKVLRLLPTPVVPRIEVHEPYTSVTSITHARN